MKKIVLVVAATAGAVAGWTLLKRRGPDATQDVSDTAGVWARAVSDAATKTADRVGDVAQSAAARADFAAQRVSDAAAKNVSSDKVAMKFSEGAATGGAAVADAADAIEGTADHVARATSQTATEAAAAAAKAAAATADEVAGQRKISPKA